MTTLCAVLNRKRKMYLTYCTKKLYKCMETETALIGALIRAHDLLFEEKLQIMIQVNESELVLE